MKNNCENCIYNFEHKNKRICITFVNDRETMSLTDSKWCKRFKSIKDFELIAKEKETFR